MSNKSVNRLAVLGMQWGDEGKGKLIDALATSTKIDYVARYQGGHNAGHTVIIDDPERQELKPRRIVLHLLPSAVLHYKTKCVIANGVAVFLPALLKEVDMVLAAIAMKGAQDSDAVAYLKSRLFVSEDCPLILPSHIALDKAAEARRRDSAIGTTGRGIGPAYEDYYARRAIKLRQLRQDNFAAKLRELLEYHNFLLGKFYGAAEFDPGQMHDELLSQYERARRFVTFTDTTELLQSAVEKNKKILFEGAQGCGLDVHHGTYPYVTSSATCVGGIFSGSGVSHRDLDAVLGVAKIYTTRVGEGPFATECHDRDGERMQQLGNEFGSTTGRPRRCGWLDLVYLRRAVRLNGAGMLFLTKVDVLDSFAKIKLCVAYDAAGGPIYEEFDGWQQDTGEITSYDKLPSQLKSIIEFIGTRVGAAVIGLSVGPERSKLILRQPVF